MVNPLSNTISEDRKPTPEEEREKFVVDFVRRNPGCSIHAVYTSKENVDFGVKGTITRIVYSLKKKGILKIEYDKNPNTKALHLYLIKENPLTIIPYQLSTLEKLFEKLIIDLGDIYSQDPSKWPSHRLSPMVNIGRYTYNYDFSLGNIPSALDTSNNFQSVMDYLSFQKKIIRNIMQLPFVIVDIIESLIKYLQRTRWLGLDENISIPLNQMLYSQMNSFNLIATRMVKKINKEPFGQDLFDEKGEYFITYENQYNQYSVFEKINLLRHRSKSIGLGIQMDRVLNYIIETNTEYFDKKFFSIGNPQWERLGWPTKRKLDIIHEFHCPSKKNKDETKCLRLDTDPTFPDF